MLDKVGMIAASGMQYFNNYLHATYPVDVGETYRPTGTCMLGNE